MSSPFTTPEAEQIIAAPSVVEVLWTNHRPAVLGGVAALLVVIFGGLAYVLSERATASASEALLAGAADDAALNEVIARYPRTPTAADAMLLLAASLRDQRKFDESDALYSRFAEMFPQSQLAVSGLLGRASNARVAGKPETAFNDYQQAEASFAGSYGAPFALFCQARMLSQDGKTEEARRVLQALGSQYSGSVAAMAAGVAQQQPPTASQSAQSAN